MIEISEKTTWQDSDSFGGKECEYVKLFMHRNYSIGLHCHEFYEINVVAEGRGIHQLGRASYNVSGGEVFVLPPFVMHGYKSEKNLNVYHILIKREFINEYIKELSSFSKFELLFDLEPYIRGAGGKTYLKLSPTKLKEFSDDLERAASLGDMLSGKEGEVFKNIACLNLISFLLTEDGIENTDEDLKRALNFMSENYSEKIRAKDIADYANISRATMFRMFKKYLKCSPNDYLTKLRCSIAEKMILEGDKKLSEIACDCGFYDSSHLKKALGKWKKG